MSELQVYVDETLDALDLSQYKQPLKNLVEACKGAGWDVTIDYESRTVNFPESIKAFAIGLAVVEYYEPDTGAFVRDMTAPLGDNLTSPCFPEFEPIMGLTDKAPVAFIFGFREVHDPESPTFLQFASQEKLNEIASRMTSSLEAWLALLSRDES